ncbi:MAG: C39 family peptidase [Candidatus Moranbacteria bacterium]|nr:C39 family peptidase [Candidatus Moranbacteria bacterium]
MKIQKEKTKNLIIWPLFLAVAFLVQGNVFADDAEEKIDEAKKEIEEMCEQEGLTEAECERALDQVDDIDNQADELKLKMKSAERMVELKQQQQKTLRNQTELLNLQISSLESDINTVNNQIDKIRTEVSRIGDQVEDKEEDISQSKAQLAEVIRIYQKLNKDMGLKLMSSQGSLTEVFNQSEYLNQTSRKIKKSLDEVRETKRELDEKKEKLQEKRAELKQKQQELEGSKEDLDSKKQEKQTLLARTQNEEAQYQALVNKIESQMRSLLIDIESLSEAKKRRLKLIQEGAIDPTSGLASTSWYYAQDDGKWENDNIAGTSLTMKNEGCAITSVAMVFSYHGEKMRPGEIAEKQSFFTKEGYIDWSSVAEMGNMKLHLDTRHLYPDQIDWDDVDDYIERGYPVIVFIRSGTGAGHYVVVHGYDEDHDDYVVHDPIAGTGPNSLLQTSKKYVSAIYDTSATVDQMIVYKPK